MTQLRWMERLDASMVDAVAGLVAAATEADGRSPVSEHVLLHLRSGHPSLNLLATVHDQLDDQLVGYAHLDPTDRVTGATGELVVHPDHRRRGLASRLLTTLLERDSGPLQLWAHGEHPAAARLAERFGFTRARVLLQLRRSLLAPLDRPRLPDGVRLRTFVAGQDEQRFVEVNNRAFEWHPEQGGWDVEQVLIREREPWFDPDGFLLAVDGTDTLLGFHWTKVHQAPQPIGEVYVLGVDPAAHGRGLGVALTLAGLAYLRGRGLREVMLYTEADNTAAVAMYRKLGFADWDTDVAYLR